MARYKSEWSNEYLEFYVQKYMEDYEDDTITEYSEGASEDDWTGSKRGFQAFLEKAAAKERTTRQKKVEKHLKSMLKHSTFHGLQFCFKKENPLRRLIWILLIFLCVGLLVQKMFESTQHFLSHPFSTAKTVMMQTEVIFPAVSLCNLNDMRTSKMLGQLSGDEYRKTIRSANHRLDNMLFDCRIKGKKCTPKDFTLFYHNQGDKCYTFNSGEPGHELVRMNRIGPSHSLELTINIEYWDYYVDVLESGVHLILHGQEETPVRMQGIVASPGFITYVEIKKRKMKNLPAPYKTDCGGLDLKYFKGYSMHLCWLEKLTDHVVKNCGCKDWFMPGEWKGCSLKELESCLWPSWVEFDKFKLYSCPQPCVIDSYVSSTSFSRFPANGEADEIAEKIGLNGTAAENLHFVRDNFLRLVLYYGDLSYEFLEQKPSYDLLVFLGDIGGQIGLFVGASVLTFMEFVDCFFMCIYSRFFEVLKPKETRI